MQKLSVCANEDGFDAHSVARIAFDAHTVFLHVFFFCMYSWNRSFDVMETKVLDIFYILNQGPIYEMQHWFLFIFYQFNETLNFLIYFKVI